MRLARLALVSLTMIAVGGFLVAGRVDAAGVKTATVRVALLKDRIPSMDFQLADDLAQGLRRAGLVVESVSCESLAQAGSFNAEKYDALVLTDSPHFPYIATDNVKSFLQAGGDLVLMGGRPFTDNLSRFGGVWLAGDSGTAMAGPDLGVLEDYEPYTMRGVIEVMPAEGQGIVEKTVRFTGTFEGTSAVGFGLLDKSRFIPLMSGIDRFGRSQGWASGMLVNYGGPYEGSNWLLFGLTSSSFYRDAAFAPMLAAALKRMRGGSLAETVIRDVQKTRGAATKLTAPAPKAFVTISADKRHFLDADGRELFFIGANYLGPAERFCRFGGINFDPRILDADFRSAHEAGINAIRLWVLADDTSQTVRDAVSQCARKYGIYLILHVARFEEDGDAIVAAVKGIAEAWKDEPMVIGYDLANEPYVTTVAPVRFGGQASPLVQLVPYDTMKGKFDKAYVDKATSERSLWPPIAGWVSEDDARQIYAADSIFGKLTAKMTSSGADYSTLTGATGTIPLEGSLGQYATALNATFDGWISTVSRAIREVDKNHFITVGYNTALAALPANGQLDFVSHHVYQVPSSYSATMKNMTTMDRMAKMWPLQPTTLGEFGYTNGLKMGKDSDLLDLHTSAVGEVMLYLYAVAHDYSGCFKWMLADLPLPIMIDTAPWIGPEKQIYEERFGFYVYDGTLGGRPKPIVYATRFLQEYLSQVGTGGEMTIERGDNAIGATYTFRGRNALFVGDKSRKMPGLQFESAVPTNLMLRWDDLTLTLVSTSDTSVVLNPEVFATGCRADRASIRGRVAGSEVQADGLHIQLLEGEAVTII